MKIKNLVLSGLIASIIPLSVWATTPGPKTDDTLPKNSSETIVTTVTDGGGSYSTSMGVGVLYISLSDPIDARPGNPNTSPSFYVNNGKSHKIPPIKGYYVKIFRVWGMTNRHIGTNTRFTTCNNYMQIMASRVSSDIIAVAKDNAINGATCDVY